MSTTKPIAATQLTQNYSAIAPSYDAVRFSNTAGRFLYERDRSIIRKLVALASPNSVLDVPTGTGRVIDYLRDQPLNITGLDCTQEMLQQAARYVRLQDTLLTGNAAALPFDDASFD